MDPPIFSTCDVILHISINGDPLNPNFYRGIKLLEHAFKLYEKGLDGHLREVVDIDKMQYGFMPGSGTVDAVCSEET